MASEQPTPWAVHCPKHGLVYLTREEYDRQMQKSDYRWECTAWTLEDPIGPCGAWSEWDDDIYEAAMYPEKAPDAD